MAPAAWPALSWAKADTPLGILTIFACFSTTNACKGSKLLGPRMPTLVFVSGLVTSKAMAELAEGFSPNCFSRAWFVSPSTSIKALIFCPPFKFNSHPFPDSFISSIALALIIFRFFTVSAKVLIDCNTVLIRLYSAVHWRGGYENPRI